MPVAGSGVNVAAVVGDMIATLDEIPYGTGLSAIQIGVPVRLSILRLGRKRGDELILVDPELLAASGRLTARTEGCLSLPHYKGSLRRRNKVRIAARDLRGKTYEYAASGYEAAVLQHELDHLRGILYWDHMDGDLPAVVVSGSAEE
jgi:peptide deformylase